LCGRSNTIPKLLAGTTQHFFFPFFSLFKARFSDAESAISKQCIQFWGFGLEKPAIVY
jgi:hypothetical protein